MNLLKASTLCLIVLLCVGALTGCQDDPSKHGGTYTAARHMNTGSNIPQASDINNATSVYKPGPGQESIGGTSGLPHGN